MELLDRYLQAVRFWLPKKQKHDIIAELSEDIRSQIEEKETGLGRKLNEAEVGAILKQLGRPVLVANRYLPQRYLIGPVLFPIYQFVLKIVTLCYLVPWILVWIGLAVSRAAHSNRTLMDLLGSFWSAFWFTAFISFAVVTIVFAVLERTQSKSSLEDWDPLKLPPVRDPNRIPRATSLIELIANLVFCIWWIGGMWYRNVLDFSSVRITLAPAWRYFFWGFLLLSLANMAVAGVSLFRPYWTRHRASLRLITDGIGSALFCWLWRSAILVEISVPNVPAAKTLEITNAINLWMSKSFPVAVVVCVVIAVVDVYRIFRVKAANTRLPGGVAAGGLPTSAVS
jgi:hypothetical protein